MLKTLQHVIQCECRLKAEIPLVVGVSGGPDSLCLLDILHWLGYTILVGHVNHGLRDEASDEARMVKATAEGMSVPCFVKEVDVKEFAGSQALSVEEAGRSLRYTFLFDLARVNGAQAVAVGHNADDQVETVLMHLLRGAGLAGLKGMSYHTLPNPWSQDIPLVRPLLGTWRDEINAYCQERGLKPTIDLTNLDITYHRNRIRNELIPYLDTYNPRLRESLWRMADVLSGDLEVIEMATAAAWQICLLEEGSTSVALDVNRLRLQPQAMQRALVRRAIQALRPGLRDVCFEDVNRALSFISNPSRSGQSDLTGGLRLLLEGERLWLVGWDTPLPSGDWPQVPPGETLLINPSDSLTLGEGWILSAEIIGAERLVREGGEIEFGTDPYQAWLDLDALKLPLLVRPRRAGDHFQPLGMDKGTLKISALFVNRKLPKRARVGWPLVCSGEDIIWVPGFEIHHYYRVQESTRQVLHMMLKRLGARSAIG